MVLRDGPEAVRDANVDALLIDEAEMASNIAEFLGLPFVSLALIPPLVKDNRYPPFYFGWSGSQRWWARLRNEIAIRVLTRVASPIFAAVNECRATWGLKVGVPEEGLSKLAQITQLPRALEFEIDPLPPHLYYTGPFVDPAQRTPMDFPWDRLDGRPLIFASLGTLQNQSREKFGMIADACASLDVQLVISLGGGLNPDQLGTLAIPMYTFVRRLVHRSINDDGFPILARFLRKGRIPRRRRAKDSHSHLLRRGPQHAWLCGAFTAAINDRWVPHPYTFFARG